MSNVVAFPLSQSMPVPHPSETANRLLTGFATQRRPLDDVFWLKENAELLGIFAATDQALDVGALEVFEEFYAQIEERLRFFPQYYRFLLSICLDLEDLGMPGNKGSRLCHAVAKAGLAEAELSDLQRAEARRLLARRGAVPETTEGALSARLHAFISRSKTFTLPNKKAAYELTHIVFYLSQYGNIDLELGKEALTSLEFAGVLAYLDQNTDLLAEICTALRFAHQTPSPIWEAAVSQAHGQILATNEGTGNDAYHAYLVTGWAQKIAGKEAFSGAIPEGGLFFNAPNDVQSTLRPMSDCLFGMGVDRSAEWDKMRGHVLPYLGPEGHEVLYQAEQSTDKFDAFFEGFARVARF